MRQFINDRACCNAEKLHVYLKYVLRFIFLYRKFKTLYHRWIHELPPNPASVESVSSCWKVQSTVCDMLTLKSRLFFRSWSVVGQTCRSVFVAGE